MAVASWQTSPTRVISSWVCFRQVDMAWPPLFHAAGAPYPSQEDGRWHRLGQGYAQYYSLAPQGAWSEFIRYESIRSAARATQQQRNLWLAFVDETDIADLSTFDKWRACGLDPRVAVGEHRHCQSLADELLSAGYRGVLSPSAALPFTVNLTVFGERYEKVLRSEWEAWRNPDRNTWTPVSLVVSGAAPPSDLIPETCYRAQRHLGYRTWLSANGIAGPPGAP